MNKIKEFFAHLKHIFKDPIKNMDEAEQRQKEIMPLLYISLGVLVVGALLATLLKLGFLHIITVIGVVGAAAFGFLLVVINKAKTKFKALTCDGCGTIVHVSGDSNLEDSWLVFCEECESELPL